MTGNDVRVCFASNMNCQHCHFCQALSSCIMVVSMEKGRGKGERKNAGAQALIYDVKNWIYMEATQANDFSLRKRKNGVHIEGLGGCCFQSFLVRCHLSVNNVELRAHAGDKALTFS